MIVFKRILVICHYNTYKNILCNKINRKFVLPPKVRGNRFSNRMDIARDQFHRYAQDWLDPIDHLAAFYGKFLKNRK